MKIEIKDTWVPLFGYIDLKEEPYNKSFIGHFINKECVVSDCFAHLDENELYAYIFFDDFEMKKVNKVFTGKVKYLGKFIEMDYLFAYGFYPESEIKISSIGVEEDFGIPESVCIKPKKL